MNNKIIFGVILGVVLISLFIVASVWAHNYEQSAIAERIALCNLNPWLCK